MIRIPLYLAIAQWALLGGLGVLVVVMFRQLGKLTVGTAKSRELGPATGSMAVPLSYTRADSDSVLHVRPGDGLPLLLAFVDPTCPSCEELVAVLSALDTTGELAQLRTLLLISDPPSYLQISEVFSSTPMEIGRPAERDGLDAYRVSGTPLLVAIDAAGMVRAAGSVVREAEVRAFAQACLLPAPDKALTVLPAAARRGADVVADRGEDAT